MYGIPYKIASGHGKKKTTDKNYIGKRLVNISKITVIVYASDAISQ